ncbi:mediator of RNA polymerase II transcription subunit 15a-like isoform X1 [Vitis riparia]|uniref:mediator of RNA polymerase II transcription subunit 15a-like isoform X1 n=1 Tax=Vitis riparia TaxID=96939 RepID=UPI00155AD82C|nr:mediator of RNA polymerase II transcription subunit 15a-like isoform X1 [Vitis riparia]
MAFPTRKFGVSLRPLCHPFRFRPQRPAQAEPVMDGGDWRAHVPPDARQRIVNYIMDTLKRVVPVSGPEQLHQLRNLAERFEEKHYSAATSRYDYLRRLAAKLLTLEGLAKTNYAAQSKKSSDGNRSSDDQKFSAIKESLRSRL